MKVSILNLQFAAYLCISLVLMAGGTLEASAADAEAGEGDAVVFKVKKPKQEWKENFLPLVNSIRYSLRTEDGTAKAGEDYKAVNRKLTFPAGSNPSPKKVKVHTILDNIDERDGETFRLILSDPKVYERYCKCYKSNALVVLPAEIVLTGRILERLPSGGLGLFHE